MDIRQTLASIRRNKWIIWPTLASCCIIFCLDLFATIKIHETRFYRQNQHFFDAFYYCYLGVFILATLLLGATAEINGTNGERNFLTSEMALVFYSVMGLDAIEDLIVTTDWEEFAYDILYDICTAVVVFLLNYSVPKREGVFKMILLVLGLHFFMEFIYFGRNLIFIYQSPDNNANTNTNNTGEEKLRKGILPLDVMRQFMLFTLLLRFTLKKLLSPQENVFGQSAISLNRPPSERNETKESDRLTS